MIGSISLKHRLNLALLIAAFARFEAHAVFLDPNKCAQTNLRLGSEVSFRMSSPEPPGRPRVAAGNLLQSRHRLVWSLRHELLRDGPEDCLTLPLPVDELAYDVEVTPTYDGVTDYGPHSLRANERVGDLAIQQMHHYRFTHDILPARAVLSGKIGILRMELGRQDAPRWGEAIGFRLLSTIEPTDLRAGHPAVEPSTEQKIRLWMMRLILFDLDTEVLFSLGDLKIKELDAFIVPGVIDAAVTRVPSFASPLGPNVPRPEDFGARLEIDRLAKTWRATRAGIRLEASLWMHTIRFAHYHMVSDLPTTRLRISPIQIDLGGLCRLDGDLAQLAACVQDTTLALEFPTQHVTGLSFVPKLRGTGELSRTVTPYLDAAMFWSERVAVASDFSSATLGNMILAANRDGSDAWGAVRHRRVLRWVFGFTWIPTLPEGKLLLVNAQYSHAHVLGLDPGLLGSSSALDGLFEALLPDVPLSVMQGDTETFTLGGMWSPPAVPFLGVEALRFSPMFVYDTRGVWVLVPSIETLPFQGLTLSLKYGNVIGNPVGPGVLRDRDIVWLRLDFDFQLPTRLRPGDDVTFRDLLPVEVAPAL